MNNKDSFEHLFEFNSKLLDNLNTGVIELDNDLTVYSFNLKASKITGISFEKINGQNICKFENLSNLIKLAKKTLKSKTGTKYKEIIITKKNNTKTPIYASSDLLYSPQNSIRGIIIVFEDLSLINDLQKKIIETEKMSILGKMTSWLIHELKSPMSVIRDLAEVILIKKIPEKKLHKYMTIIIGQIDRFNFLIQGISEFLRPKKPCLSKIDLCKSVKEIVDLYKDTFTLNNSEKISFNFISDKPQHYITFDKDQLQQILFNLIKNSIDSICHKGQITLTILEIKDNISLEIKDNGCGMDRDTIKQAFNAFYTTKLYNKGSGLGLAITKTIVEKHGNQIELDSRINEGTIVKIKFNKIS